MKMAPSPSTKTKAILSFLLIISIPTTSSALSIGVNYGTIGDNLPTPATVAAFLLSNTFIDKIKIFDANPNILRAFANTGISVAIAIPDADIPSLAKSPSAATTWVANNISPFTPNTDITLISIGNEVLATQDRNLISLLVPAMQSMHSALVAAGLPNVRVASPSSLGILSVSKPPSAGCFRRGYDQLVFAPMLEFHRRTKTPFMVNPYPYFGYGPDTLDYALFRPNAGVFDEATKKNYTNMFDAMLDAVHAAMDKLGYGDVEMLVGETGWPTAADNNQYGVSVEDARDYNTNLIKKVNSGEGTPMMPGQRFETYVFSLFNENLKPGPTAERNFGLFKPDFTPVYDAGIIRDRKDGHGNSAVPTPSVTRAAPPVTIPVSTPPAVQAPVNNQNGSSRSGADADSAPSQMPQKKWCMLRAESSDQQLQDNINYVCNSDKADCSPIREGGECYNPNTLQAHAAFAMNSFYQSAGQNDSNCDFNGTGVLTTTNPSYGSCKYS